MTPLHSKLNSSKENSEEKIEVLPVGLIKECCPACGSQNFAVARDMIGTRHCSVCFSQWIPAPRLAK